MAGKLAIVELAHHAFLEGIVDLGQAMVFPKGDVTIVVQTGSNGVQTAIGDSVSVFVDVLEKFGIDVLHADAIEGREGVFLVAVEEVGFPVFVDFGRPSESHGLTNQATFLIADLVIVPQVVILELVPVIGRGVIKGIGRAGCHEDEGQRHPK